MGPASHAHTHPRMNTQACARTRANTSAHVHMRTHPRYGGACTQVHAARKHMHAGIRTMHMHVYARARANTPAHVYALVQTHAHIFWLRANVTEGCRLAQQPWLQLPVPPTQYTELERQQFIFDTPFTTSLENSAFWRDVEATYSIVRSSPLKGEKIKFPRSCPQTG